MNRWTKVALRINPSLAKKIEKSGNIGVVDRLKNGRIKAITKTPNDKNPKEKKVSESLQKAKQKAFLKALVKIAGFKIAADSVTGFALGTVNAVGNTVTGVIDTVGNTVTGVIGTVGNTVTGVIGTAGNTVSSISNGYFQMIGSVVSSFSTGGQISADMKTMLAGIDEMSVTVDCVKKLSYLSVGIGLANLGMEIVGIVYVGRRLNDVKKKLDQLSIEIGQVKSILTSEKISDYHRMCLKFSSISVRLKDGDAVDRNDIEALLIDMRTFVSEMIRNFYYDAMDVDLILEMVFNLLTAYVGLLNIYVREYYFEKGRLPDNLESYNSLFKELLDDGFLKLVGDYLVIKKGLLINDVVSALQTQQVLVMNGVLQYEDQIDILKMIETKEEYLSLIKITEKCAEEEIREYIPEITKDTGIENCQDVIKNIISENTVAQAL